MVQGDLRAIQGRTLWTVNLLQRCLSADFEFGPNFVLAREQLDAFLHMREMQASCVGNQDKLEERKDALGANVHNGFDHFGEVRTERRLPVAAQGDFLEL